MTNQEKQSQAQRSSQEGFASLTEEDMTGVTGGMETLSNAIDTLQTSVKKQEANKENLGASARNSLAKDKVVLDDATATYQYHKQAQSGTGIQYHR